ncbi:MAG: hypothetical protein COC24_005935 [Alphaproteobacteria bacterium]|nr:hypothetical protein [Alphaproteobacteria bacterium]
MPHITIEFSKNLDKSLDMQKILQICLTTTKTNGLLDMSIVEARASQVDYGLTIEGEATFLHVKIALFPGRDAVKLATLSKAIHEELAAYANQEMNQTASISTQIVEMDPKFCFHS